MNEPDAAELLQGALDLVRAHIEGPPLHVYRTVPSEVSARTEFFTATRTIFLPAAGGAPTTAAGCSERTKVEIAAQLDDWALDFDGETKEYAFWDYAMPDNYNGGTVTARFHWFCGTGNTSSVRWGLQCVGLNDQEALSTALGTAQEVTDTNIATANSALISAATPAITPGGSPAGGRKMRFVAYRDPAADTLSQDARLMLVHIEYGTNAYSD